MNPHHTCPLKVTPVEHEICRFYVESSVEGRDPYLVDIEDHCCGCWHFMCRLYGTGESCKHLDAAKQHHKRLVEAKLMSANDGI